MAPEVTRQLPRRKRGARLVLVTSGRAGGSWL